MISGASNEYRRRKVARRGLPLLAVAVAAFVAGVVVGAAPPDSVVSAKKYTTAWSQLDYPAMYELLSTDSKAAITVEDFIAAYEQAQDTATIKTISAAEPAEPRKVDGADVVGVPITAVTVSFGTIRSPLHVPYSGDGIRWQSSLVFPGLRPGEELEGRTETASRAAILARDGTPLAEGPALAREHPIGSEAIDVTGIVGDPDEEQQERLQALGLPIDTPSGVNGLERAFNTELYGQPGGKLLAIGGREGQPRVIGEADPVPRDPIRTTIDPDLQIATVDALAGRNGGIAVLDARNGAIRALAGLAYSAPQPPGSTFKIITTAAALEKEIVSLEDEFEYVTGVSVDGRTIDNAHQELCGGTFPETFAHSCNSVFLPLGDELGPETLIEYSERFGFNSPPEIFNEAATEAIDPPSSSIPTDISPGEEAAVSAIGQGRVLATPLRMASVAQTVANAGVRSPTPIVTEESLRPDAEPVRAVPRSIARTLRDLMVGVVEYGTGPAAAVEGIRVAGKTGTAELGPKTDQDLGPDEEPEQMVDAWFTAFAPANRPRLAVAVMLIDADGGGGSVAAPAAGEILAAGLTP